MEHFMTSEEIAEILHVDPVTIRRLVNKGELPAYRIGADYRFAPSDLKDYLQRQRIPPLADTGVAPKLSQQGGTPTFIPSDQTVIQRIRQALSGKGTSPSKVVDRFDRFTKRARNVLTLAQEEAQRFQHNYIGTEHLLLGLVREGNGVAAQVLNNMGVELDKVRSAVEFIIGRGDHIVVGEVGLTPRSKKVIELAVDEARRLNHHFVGTEHLLLGMIHEGEGIAAGILTSLGVSLEKVRTETIQVLSQHEHTEAISVASVLEEEAPLPAEAEKQKLTCSHCGTRCPNAYHYCFNCGHQLAHEEDKSSEDKEK